MAKITKSIRTSEITYTIYDVEAQETSQINVTMLGNAKNDANTLKKIRKEQDTERVIVLRIDHIETTVNTYRVDVDKFLAIAEKVIRKPRQNKNGETPNAATETASPAKRAKK